MCWCGALYLCTVILETTFGSVDYVCIGIEQPVLMKELVSLMLNWVIVIEYVIISQGHDDDNLNVILSNVISYM